jgi:hypothetical protein
MPVEPNRFGQVSIHFIEAEARRHETSGEHVAVVRTSEAQRNVGFTTFEADHTKISRDIDIWRGLPRRPAAYPATGVANSASLAMLSGQRCITLL